VFSKACVNTGDIIDFPSSIAIQADLVNYFETNAGEVPGAGSDVVDRLVS
jgi:hypothetical protein